MGTLTSALTIVGWAIAFTGLAYVTILIITGVCIWFFYWVNRAVDHILDYLLPNQR